MMYMSSTTSQRSQVPLHLPRQEALYARGMTLGELVKTARKAKGLSLDKLGRELGVSRQLVWQWEHGETDPTVHIQALCRVLDVPYEYFYGTDPAIDPLITKLQRLSPTLRAAAEAAIDALLASQDHPQKNPIKRNSVK